MPWTEDNASGVQPSTVRKIGSVVSYLILKALLPNSSPAEKHGFAATSEQKPEAAPTAHAAEQHRGRDAVTPTQIPWLGWKDILWRTYAEFQEDRLLAIAAGVVFYALLALFPAVTALVSIYGLFATPSTINGHLAFLSTVMPEAGVSIVNEQVSRIVSKGDAKLGFGFAFGLALALWSANAGIKAVIDALNVVYEETEKRGFFKLNLISLTFTVGAVVAMLSAIAAVVVVPLLFDRVGVGALAEALISYGRWPMLVVALLAALAILYRYGPSRREPQWKWVSVGSVLATALWIAGSAALSYYLRHHANYDATYGSLGAGIGLMMWMWMTTIVVLFGAELNSEIEHQTAVDSTVGPPKPLGTREATMADTVGTAQ
jgi:membrane protein